MGDLLRRLCGHLTKSLRASFVRGGQEDTKVYFSEIAKLIKWSNPGPPTKHNRSVLIWAGEDTKSLNGGGVSPFHEFAV